MVNKSKKTTRTLGWIGVAIGLLLILGGLLIYLSLVSGCTYQSCEQSVSIIPILAGISGLGLSAGSASLIARGKQPVEPPVVSSTLKITSLEAELNDLADMKSRGVISDDEYERLRQNIIHKN